MKKIIDNLFLGLTAAIFLSVAPSLISAQNIWSTPSPKPETSTPARPEYPLPKTPAPSPYPLPTSYFGGNTSEKSIKVDGWVVLTLCATQGTIKVNGWNRNEVRVFVKEGAKFGFSVLEKSPKTSAPSWIKVVGTENKGKYGSTNECIWGNEIEIDAPVNATINITGTEITTKVDTAKKVKIETVGGDISLRNIASGIYANAGQGSITVEESKGSINLESATGNILVFETGPSEIGDVFKARTNSGEISLQRVAHRQIEVKSISGSVTFAGEILNGGSYTLGTSRGSIRMTIPVTSSFQLQATYGFGKFESDFPVKIATENVSPGPIKSIVGKVGNGDAMLRLTTTNGSIAIKKQ